jgi:hypothetical protein
MLTRVSAKAVTKGIAEVKRLNRPTDGLFAGRYLKIGPAGAWMRVHYALARYGITPLRIEMMT